MTDFHDLNYMNNDLAPRKEQFSPNEILDCHENGFISLFKFKNNAILRVHVISDIIIQFKYGTEGELHSDFSYAIPNQIKEQVNFYELKDLDNHYRLTTDKLILLINKEDGKKRILNRSGKVLCEDEKGFHWETDNSTGNDIIMMSKQIQSSEHFYGLGDKSCSLDLRGKAFQLWGSDTYAYGKESDPLYKNIPFFISLHKKLAYGIFFDNTFRSFFDFGKERGKVFSFWAQGGEMNYYFIYGPEMMDVCKSYTELTGKPELPPLWSLGFHQCKWSYYPESKIEEITTGFRERQIPCDAIYLDIDYMDGFRCFTWNKNYFPEPKKMIKKLNDNGFKTVVIIDPGIKIDPNYSVYNEAKEKGFFCRRADGPLMKGSVWPGLCNFPDFTDPEVRDWWRDLFKGLIEDNGVAGVWNDMNEPAVFEEGTFPDDVRFNYDGHPTSHRKAHNVYGMQMARATYEGVKKFGYPRRPFVITRSGYSGLQKYSSVWTGDNVASWEHLKIANTQCQRLSSSGISFCGSDIGGFIQMPNGELFARWIQLGIFHPFCRVHSSGDHGDQEPWSFGDDITEIVKKFIELRYQLLPYIYTTFWQYCNDGSPMIRPLAFLGQKDPETFYRQEEFGLGDQLLVCPITEEKEEGRWLYLPTGNWYYFWNDKLHEGQDEVWADAGLDRMPIYIKAGAVIPFYPVQQYVGEKKIETLTLHIYFGQSENTSTLYEDQGNGYEYEEKEQCNVKTFDTIFENETFFIKQNIKGSYETEYKSYEIMLHGFNSIHSISCDGEEKSIENSTYIDANIQTITVATNFKEIIVK